MDSEQQKTLITTELDGFEGEAFDLQSHQDNDDDQAMDGASLAPSNQRQHHRQRYPSSTSTSTSPSTTTGGNKSKKLFPQKLWDLINDDKYNFCLRWSDDGQLVYLNRDDFEVSYLKTAENQFHTQKAISFVRQMNMYGFRKVDDCYYENDNFKRNCAHLLKFMVRKHPIKNPNGTAKSDLTHPQFTYPTGASSSSFFQPSPGLSTSTAAAAVSLLAPVSANYIDFSKNHQIFDNQPQLINDLDNGININKTRDTDHQHSVKDDGSNEDSQSSQSLSLSPLSTSNLDQVKTPCINNNICEDIIAQQQQQQTLLSLYSDQREIVKALMMQQASSQFPCDLLTNPADGQPVMHFGNNDLATIYYHALLSSMNMYQQPANVQANPNLSFDINKFPGFNQVVPDSQHLPHQLTKRDDRPTVMDDGFASDKSATSTSLLARQKYQSGTRSRHLRRKCKPLNLSLRRHDC